MIPSRSQALAIVIITFLYAPCEQEGTRIIVSLKFSILNVDRALSIKLHSDIVAPAHFREIAERFHYWCTHFNDAAKEGRGEVGEQKQRV